MSLTAQTIGLITVIGAVIVPPIVSFLKSESWPSYIKQAICLIASAAVAVVAVVIDQPKLLTGSNVVVLAGFIFTTATFVYSLLFHGSTIDSALTKIGLKKMSAPAALPKSPS